MKKVYIKTWGCQMNEYDSSLIVSQLKKKELYEFVNSPEIADILILNTCSIREKAQEKLFHQLGRWKILKKNNPSIIIAVGGCVAVQEGENLYKRAKYVNVIFGTQTLHRLSSMLNIAKKSNKLIIDIHSQKTIEKFDDVKYYTSSKKSNLSSLVAIMEGCNKFCSFCIVPYTRGREISRSPIKILNEIKQLSSIGAKEIILLGQNVNSYMGRHDNGKKCNFSELLYLISNIVGINRIQFITSHPIHFTDELIQAYKNIPKLINSLHLPVQSGSNRILKLMRRRYSVERYLDVINKLKKVRSNLHISSDFIVGFPGETEKDFKKTIELVKNVNFDMSYSFLYSSRPGTPASKLIQNTTIEERKKRLYLLQKTINSQAKLLSKKMLNSVQPVLVHGVSKNDITKLSGKTENNRIVNFEGKVHMIGKLIFLYITSVKKHTLTGRVVNLP